MSKFKDLSGQKFGRLTAIKRVENKGRITMWLCKCECGREKIVSYNNLKNGHSRSCGCFRQESALIHSSIHGLSKTRIYKIFMGMKKRCFNKKYFQFYLYGGRGITICDEWKNDFKAFYNWAMANGYQDDLTIDRINNDGNYEPSNCRWITAKEQNLNTRKNKYITFQNQTLTLKEWAELRKLSYKALQHRLARNWDIERALFTPVKNSQQYIDIQ